MHDDEYRGYFIPEKTAVIANTWAILRDESVYPQADKFIPERFLEPDVPDSIDVAFGFGRRCVDKHWCIPTYVYAHYQRRICPGMLIAQENVFLNVASMLAALNISKAKDPMGRVIEPVVEGLPGTIWCVRRLFFGRDVADDSACISFPKAFKVSITPRSKASADLIHQSVKHSKTLSDKLEIFALDS